MTDTKQYIENFRVGITEDGMTTFSLLNEYGTHTLFMSKSGCERLIQMLRATYSDTYEETK